MYFAFEESPQQILRNARSIGIDLGPAMERGLLAFHAERPRLCGLEMHLARMHRDIANFSPRVVIVDPVTSLTQAGGSDDVTSMLLRLIDFLKMQGITALFTSLTGGAIGAEATDVGVSSLMDTWLLLRHVESDGERRRGLYILKSRGMAHSNAIHEFMLTDHGIRLRPSGRPPGTERARSRRGRKANGRTEARQ